MTKESLSGIDKRLIFRETFNSEQSTRDNGGTPANVDFSNGVGIFNGTSSEIDYRIKNIGKVYSARVRLTMKSLQASGILGTSGSDYILFFDSGTNKLYLNGAGNAKYVVWDADLLKHEILVTRNDTKVNFYIDGNKIGATQTLPGNNDGSFKFIGSLDGGTFTEGDYELVELYNVELTANEVKNLAEDKSYRELSNNINRGEILNVNANKGSIINKYVGDTINGNVVPEVSNTDMEVVKDSNNIMKFNGSTSKIDCGNYNDLTGDITVLSWIKPYGWGEGGKGSILDNGKLLIALNVSNEDFFLSSDGSSTKESAHNSISLNKWNFICSTRTSTGVINMYVGGALSGTPNQSSSTPVIGSTNIIVGAAYNGTVAFDGLINGVRIIKGILTTQEMAQIYTNEKARYGK